MGGDRESAVLRGHLITAWCVCSWWRERERERERAKRDKEIPEEDGERGEEGRKETTTTTEKWNNKMTHSSRVRREGGGT